jgi:hypothetical protein
MNLAEATASGKTVVTMPSEARPNFEVQRGPRLGDSPPPFAPEAFHGIAGEFVDLVEPNTEACNEALLIQFLTVYGYIVGRGPHYIADGGRHTGSLFAVVVGDTSKARKGTSWNHVRRVFEEVDPDFMASNRASGLSSGKGLIYRIRDALEGYGDKPGDPGVADKRLLVFEDEFARPLKVSDRQGSTLSTIVRSAWDGAPLQTLTRSNPLVSTDPHVGIVGHITKEELLAVLAKTDVDNGLANRHLWIYSKRSKRWPFGGDDYDIEPLVRRLRASLAHAQRIERMLLDDGARELWSEMYETLSEPQPGTFGNVTARGEAQVMRLSLLYALLYKSNFIRTEHLQAAVAVWEYAKHSAAFIFDEAIADKTTRRILEALAAAGERGLNRTGISDALGRNVSSNEIQQVLAHQRRRGRVVRSREAGRGGRKLEVWRVADY